MKDLKYWLCGFIVVCVVLLTYGITRGLYHDSLEDACVETGWYETYSYRLVCQDIVR